jgi:hypothetical protein
LKRFIIKKVVAIFPRRYYRTVNFHVGTWAALSKFQKQAEQNGGLKCATTPERKNGTSPYLRLLESVLTSFEAAP